MSLVAHKLGRCQHLGSPRTGEVDSGQPPDLSRPLPHHHHPVGEEDRLGDAVSYEKHRRLRLLPDPQELLLERFARQRVQGGERLVHQQDPRFVRQGPGDRRLLPHPPAELVRVAVLESIQPHHIEISVRRLPALLPGNAPDLGPEFHVLPDRPPGKKQKLLEHDGVPGIRALYRPVFQEKLAAGHRLQARHHHQKRRLPASTGTDNGNELIRFNLEGEILERGGRLAVAGGVDLPDIPGLNERHSVSATASAR